MKGEKAVGPAKAPYLFVMLSKPSEKMEAWFWRLLHGCGIKKKDVRIVYILDEPPAGANGAPLKPQLRESRDRFVSEIKKSKPAVVVPMGSLALYELTGVTESIFNARGYLIRKDLFRPVPTEVWKQIGTYKNASKATGATKGSPKMKWVKEAQDGLLGANFPGVVIPVFTLDHIRTEQFAVKPAFKEDIARAHRVVELTLSEIDKDLVYWSDFGTTVCNGVSTLMKKSLRNVKLGEMIAIDIETHGVDNEVIDLVSFSDGTTTASLEWNEDACYFISSLFAKTDKIFAIHNSPFDIPRLIRGGVTISQHCIDHQIFDTMFGSVIIQPDLHKGLGRIAPVYLDISPWKWRTIIDSDHRFYSAKDAFVTAWLGIQEYAVMKGMKVLDLFRGTNNFPGPGVMATIPELTAMSDVGIRTNKKAAAILCDSLERRMFRYHKLWNRMFPNVSVTSNPQLAKLFYAHWGLPPERTEKDGVSVNELSLIKLGAFVEANRGSDLFPGAWHEDERCTERTFTLILRIREYGKLLSTYVQPLLLSAENWVHPQYLPSSKDDERGAATKDVGIDSVNKGNTATGRLVAYNPNIQNQPKRSRILYVPDTDEMCFIQADYRSAELYVLAAMSGDRRLREDLQYDLHQRNADRLGIARKSAKNVTYASQYLAGPAKQSEMILNQEHTYLSPRECLDISNGIWGYYTDAAAYKLHLIQMCEMKHYIVNPFGRVRFFHSGSATAAVNFIPQSIVADVLWCVLKPIADMVRSYGGRLVTTVHDSILVCVPENVRDEVAGRMKQIMEKRFDNVAKDFYIPVEVEVGEPGASWAHLHKFDPPEAI